MADAKVSALTDIGTIADGDWLYIVDKDAGGAGVHVGKRVDMSVLTAYLEQRGRQHNSSVATQSPAANTDVYITGSDVAIPYTSAGATRLQAKSKYSLSLWISKGAAGTGTPTFNVRVGTAGTTADTSRCLFTWPAANTAAADVMRVVIEATFRTVGSGTSTVIQGGLAAEHQLTTTGFGGTGLGANIILNTTGGGFDATVANLKIGVSHNGGTSSAWSILQARAQLENLA